MKNAIVIVGVVWAAAACSDAQFAGSGSSTKASGAVPAAQAPVNGAAAAPAAVEPLAAPAAAGEAAGAERGDASGKGGVGGGKLAAEGGGDGKLGAEGGGDGKLGAERGDDKLGAGGDGGKGGGDGRVGADAGGDGQTSDGQTSDGKTSDGKTSDGKTSDGKTSDDGAGKRGDGAGGADDGKRAETGGAPDGAATPTAVGTTDFEFHVNGKHSGQLLARGTHELRLAWRVGSAYSGCHIHHAASGGGESKLTDVDGSGAMTASIEVASEVKLSLICLSGPGGHAGMLGVVIFPRSAGAADVWTDARSGDVWLQNGTSVHAPASGAIPLAWTSSGPLSCSVLGIDGSVLMAPSASGSGVVHAAGRGQSAFFKCESPGGVVVTSLVLD